MSSEVDAVGSDTSGGGGGDSTLGGACGFEEDFDSSMGIEQEKGVACQSKNVGCAWWEGLREQAIEKL